VDATDSLIVIAGVAAGTFAVRSLPFIIGRRIKFPPLFLDWLILMSLGIIAGLVSKSLFTQNSLIALGGFHIKFIAILIAAAVQKKWNKILLSLLTAVSVATLIKHFADTF